MTELMREVGLPQTPEPTTIYCDNTAAILIMENKGAIGKRRKEMDTKIYALRDRIADQEVQLEYLGTEEMAADIGTKPLAREKFEYFRDIIAMIRSSQMNTPFIVKESGKKRTKIMTGKDLRKTTNHEGEGPHKNQNNGLVPRRKIKEKLKKTPEGSITQKEN
jgi:hypothetical protein